MFFWVLIWVFDNGVSTFSGSAAWWQAPMTLMFLLLYAWVTLWRFLSCHCLAGLHPLCCSFMNWRFTMSGYQYGHSFPGDETTNFSFCSSLNMLVFRSWLSWEPDITLFAISHSYSQKPVLDTIKLQFWGINLIFISLCFIQLREWMEQWEMRHYYSWRFQQCLFR
jgi:hypothetical protein